MSSECHIRSAMDSDREAFYEVCLKTSDNGADGSDHHDDPRALGNIYVGPYLEIEREFALALEDGDGVCGYCLATPDSGRFYKKFREEWLPPIQATLTQPTGPSSQWSVTQQIHDLLLNPDPLTFYPDAFRPWPAHLHVDLLPRAQGRGLGPRLMEVQMASLRNAGATGIHLCVAPGNARALAFYRKLGFSGLPVSDQWPADTVYLGKRL